MTVFALVAARPVEALHLAGIVDRDGNEVVPCKCRHVTAIGGGLFFIEEDVDPPPRPGRIVTARGIPVPVRLPKGTTLAMAYLPRSAPARVLQRLPNGSIIAFRNEKKLQGLSDVHGNVITEPKFRLVLHYDNGYIGCYSGPAAIGLRHKLELVYDPFSRRRIALPSGTEHVSFNGSGPYPATIDHLYGYVDASGRLVLARKYASAQPFNKFGIAIVVRSRTDHPDPKMLPDLSAGWLAIDRQGRTIFGPAEHINNFGDGSAFVVTQKQNSELACGLVDHSGKLILPIEYYQILPLNNDLLAVRRQVQSNWLLMDRAGRQIADLGKMPDAIQFKIHNGVLSMYSDAFPSTSDRGILDQQSPKSQKRELNLEELCAEPIADSFNASPVGLIDSATGAKIVRCIEPRFRAWRWSHPFNEGDFSYNRIDSFAALLRNHNLIGMSWSELEPLLGKPDSPYTYCLIGGFCANAAVNVRFDVQDGIVRGWRECGMEWQKDWIRRNVVFDEDDPGRILRDKAAATVHSSLLQ